MNSIDTHRWLDVLGWTLLHSLWQGILIGLLFLWVRSLLPTASASIKYAISTGALLLILLSAVGTFIYLFPDTVTSPLVTNKSTTPEMASLPSERWPIDPAAWVPAFTGWINDHLPFLVGSWVIGILFFGCRLVITWSYTVRLRIGAEPIVGFWQNKISELASDLGIGRTVLLAESKGIDAPLLLGYLKPIILLPFGMISGLSPDQVETILLHELAHIRRHDFAINFIQSVIEVIFFFNPFVWMISSQIRSDREQCCDDWVVRIKSPLVYAQALHQLAEAQTLGTSFSLGVAGTKNKLLQRIKRIMKTTERKEESRGKVIPAVLVMMALVAASWLSIQAYLPEKKSERAVGLVEYVQTLADTTKKDLQEGKSESKHSRTITTFDSKGEPHTEIIERSEGDYFTEPVEPTEPVVMPFMSDFEVPVIPEIPEIELQELEALKALNFNLEGLDTLQPRVWGFGPDREEWEKEFTEKFRERFSDFYEKNRPEFDKMMKELDENLKKLHANIDQNLAYSFDRKLQSELGRVQAELQRLPQQEEMMRRAQSEQIRAMDKAQSEQIRAMNEKVRHHQEELAIAMREQQRIMMKDQQSIMKSMEMRMKSFEKELAEQLKKDGYLGKDEKLSTINWEGDSGLRINGKKIKDSDQKKYKDLHKKYFKEGSRIGVAE